METLKKIEAKEVTNRLAEIWTLRWILIVPGEQLEYKKISQKESRLL
jgi:hypothetical protein